MRTTNNAGDYRLRAIWITPWVLPNQEVILDTGAMTKDERRGVASDGDDMPEDTVLVLVHPARYSSILDVLKTIPPTSYAVLQDSQQIGRDLAAYIIDGRCRRDPELKQRLRWRSD